MRWLGIDSKAFGGGLFARGAGGSVKAVCGQAEVALRTIKEKIPRLRSVKRIRFVLFADKDLAVHEEALSRIFG